MNTRLKRIMKIAAIGLFVIALANNIASALSDPFSTVSAEALAETTGSGDTWGGSSSGGSYSGGSSSGGSSSGGSYSGDNGTGAARPDKKAIQVVVTEQVPVYGWTTNWSLGGGSYYGVLYTNTVVTGSYWCCSPATVNDKCFLSRVCS